MKIHKTMIGYKATDANMKCRGFQFELGKWFKHKGELKFCESGFHFCVHPSGPWSYCSDAGTRIFKVEGRNVLCEYESGSQLKVVCGEIRFVEEINVTGHSNTGHRNTGDRNTGDYNTGDRNTGDYNTGDRNTGYWNTGDRNTGNWNTGNWNATSRSCGLFCAKEPCVIVFDRQTKLTMEEFTEKYPKYSDLGQKLITDDPFDYSEFKAIPGWTLKKCKALHAKMIAARVAMNKEEK